MSVHATELTTDPVGSRHGYRLEQGSDADPYTASDSSTITLEVWDEGYNAEWRSDITLDSFIEIVDDIDGITGADAVAWFGSTDVEPYRTESTYPAVTDLADFPHLCGNLRLEGDDYEIYWEATKGEATIEVTSSHGEFDVVAYLYEETVPAEERLDSAEVIEQIQTLLDE